MSKTTDINKDSIKQFGPTNLIKPMNNNEPTPTTLSEELNRELEVSACKHLTEQAHFNKWLRELTNTEQGHIIDMLKEFAQSPIAKRIHREGYISIEENKERVEYKKKCRREAITIQELSKPIGDSKDPMVNAMFDLLHMVMVLTNDIDV